MKGESQGFWVWLSELWFTVHLGPVAVEFNRLDIASIGLMASIVGGVWWGQA